jgi:hypothetical protein
MKAAQCRIAWIPRPSKSGCHPDQASTFDARLLSRNRSEPAGTASGIPACSAFCFRADTWRGKPLMSRPPGNHKNLKMNHCEHCGMKQGDFELFEEFDTPFCPINPRDASRVLLRPVSEAFAASAASIAYEPGFFPRMRICLDKPTNSRIDRLG